MVSGFLLNCLLLGSSGSLVLNPLFCKRQVFNETDNLTKEV
jgi:hypothetical protein